jgi:biopolymer transport protein ExbD
MRFRKPTVEPLEINLTPMIDCLLFLIVFLLLATSFNHFSRLNIILPEAEGVALTEEKNSIEVAVQEDGSYLLLQRMPMLPINQWCGSWTLPVSWVF